MVNKFCLILLILAIGIPCVCGLCSLVGNIVTIIKHKKRRPMLNQLEKDDFVYAVKNRGLIAFVVDKVHYRFGKDNKLKDATIYLKEAFNETWGESEIIDINPNNNKSFEYVNSYGDSFYTIKSLAKAKYKLMTDTRNSEIEKFKNVQYSDIIESINKSIEALEKFKNKIYNKNDRNTR